MPAIIGTDGTATWTPIPEFSRSDADVTLLILAGNQISYEHATSDPFFSANWNVTALGQEYFLSDSYLRLLGCAEQYQVCNPNKPSADGQSTLCGPLSTTFSLADSLPTVDFNDKQLATAGFMAVGLSHTSLWFSVDGRGSQALEAQSTVFGREQIAALPNNQWHAEVGGWFQVGLATLQQFLLETAIGPINIVESGGVLTPPGDDAERAICKRQTIRNASGYQNFSILGVAIILVLGVILIALGWGLDIVVGWIEKLFGWDFLRLSWITDDYLQLQRLAYEAAGDDSWVACVKDVPVMKGNAAGERRVPALDIQDKLHPRVTSSKVDR